MNPRRKPILGIVGGIGAGKSFASRILGSLGCLVIDSDAQARDAFADAGVVAQLRTLFGDVVIRADGSIDRKLVGARIFREPILRAELEAIVHPFIAAQRDAIMLAHATDPAVRAFVWDSPLLFEAGLDAQCDAVIFVDAPHAVRLHRVKTTRGWDEAELARREASQMAIDEKRKRSRFVVPGDADEAMLRAALTRVLDEIAPIA
jgi:dephospho-CoA kinase